MARTADIAARRPAYQADLAEGTERFFLPRRESCPWCESPRLRERLRTRDHAQAKPGTFVLDECLACGHVFQNPRLSEEGLDFYYRDFYDGLGEDATKALFGGRGAVKRFRNSARAMRPHALPGSWLDVGTAHGQFCAAAKEVLPDCAFDGLDMGEAVELAAKEGRIRTAYRGRLVELAGELAGRYDAVSMFHYLEHTLEQRKELAAAHTVLRPGGHLVIEVPDPQSAFGRLLGQYWMPWFQPQHLHFAPYANLRRELESSGFTVVAGGRRGDQHIPVDLVCGARFLLGRAMPKDDAPWLAKKPGRAAWTVRAALTLVALPPLLLLHAAELALAPLARRTALSNAYRIIARRD